MYIACNNWPERKYLSFFLKTTRIRFILQIYLKFTVSIALGSIHAEIIVNNKIMSVYM